MIDGSVGEVYGDIFKPRKTVQKADTQKLWDKCYWRARNSKDGMTFKQAEGLFVAENHYWPPRTLFRMPNEPFYWWQKVRDVPREKLNQPQHAEDQG